MKDYIDTLVISGGGVKGIAYIGVLKKLKEMELTKKIKLDIKRICCVSVGCLFGLMYILGYGSDEMKYEVMNKNFDELKNVKFTNIIKEYGLDNGECIITWIETLMIKKGYSKDMTMKELYEITNVKLQIVTTDLSKYDYYIFDSDKTPDVKVTFAIRLSISIPFIFTAEKYEGNIHVDGALINNYPIRLFKNELEHVLGIKIVTYGELESHNVMNDIKELDEYIKHVMTLFFIQKEKNILLSEQYNEHTIYINTEKEHTAINFKLKKNEKKRLIELGYEGASNYFEKKIEK
jgi:NTE family protein